MEQSFPLTLDYLPEFPPKWRKPALVNLRSSFHLDTTNEVPEVLGCAPHYAVSGIDGISYMVLREAYSAAPMLFPTLFTALL